MSNQDIIAGVLQRVGQRINAQLTITWDTKQTLEQFLEILGDNSQAFDFDIFMEYVSDNSIEELMFSLNSEGKSLLEENFFITDSNGKVLY